MTIEKQSALSATKQKKNAKISPKTHLISELQERTTPEKRWGRPQKLYTKTIPRTFSTTFISKVRPQRSAQTDPSTGLSKKHHF